MSIHREYLNGRAADRGPSRDSSPSELKAPGPEISTRMEEANEFTRSGIESRDVRPFVTVAMRAGEGEVVQNGISPALFGDDVVDLEWQRKSELRNATVLAVVSGAIPYRPSQFPVHRGKGSVLDFEQAPGFGLHYAEQKSDTQIAVEFLRFAPGQGTGWRFLGELVHALLIA